MTANCLVTKLNGIVDNENLEKLGHLHVSLSNNSSSAQNFSLTGSSFVFNNTEYTDGSTVQISPNTEGILEVLNKYTISGISISSGIEVDFADKLKFSEDILSISIPSSQGKINLSSLNNLSVMKEFIAQECIGNVGTFEEWTTTSVIACNFHNNRNIYGDISWFGDQDSLTTLSMCNANISGNLESFFKKKILRNNLNNVYSLYAGYGSYNHVKFGGVGIQKDNSQSNCGFYIVDNGGNSYTCGISYGSGYSSATHRYFATYNKTTDTWSNYQEVNS